MIQQGENAIRSAMAKTVGLPCVIAAHLYLDGKLNLSGVHIPTTRDIYQPVLEKLAAEGIVFKSSISRLEQ